MKPYELNIPTSVYFGRNIWREAIKALDSLISGNILLVTTGRSLKRLGYVEELESELKVCSGVDHVKIFDEVSPNPRLSQIREGIRLSKEAQADVVIGFGGGSAMDAAKAIAVGASTGQDISSFLYHGKEPGQGTLPVIAIPTTAGTGSELSKAAIITDEEKKIKGGIRGKALYPKAAIVDSLFTESMPLRTTMETGFDVFAHGMESYISLAASPFTRMLSEQAIRMVGEYLPRLITCPEDREARERMSFASMVMGINLGNAGTCLPHRLQYPLGARTDTSHGAGLAALFTSWVRWEYDYAPCKVERAVSLLQRQEVHGKKDCVETIRGFIDMLGLPLSLKMLGAKREELDVMVSEVTGNVRNDPAAREDGIIMKLYAQAFEER